METMRDAGMSLRQIAGQLEVNESPSRSGKPWTAEAVRVILKRAS
jgi:hypothetical protein